MPAPDKIKQLVETFEQNLNEYHTQESRIRKNAVGERVRAKAGPVHGWGD